MWLLLVVVLLFSSSSCSVSSHQYYVSDNCSSVTYTPCASLLVYAANISQYNNSALYFIGTTTIHHYNISLSSVKNITLRGLYHSSLIMCDSGGFSISNSSQVMFSSISMYGCDFSLKYSSNITIIASKFNALHNFETQNTFDMKVISSSFTNSSGSFTYSPSSECSNDLHHYSLVMNNVTKFDEVWKLIVVHGASYYLFIKMDHIDVGNSSDDNMAFFLSDSLYSIVITNSSFHHSIDESLAFYFVPASSSSCPFRDIQLSHTVVIEDSYFYDNYCGIFIRADNYFMSRYHNIIIKFCSIRDNTGCGLAVNANLLISSNFSIINTEFTGNGGNTILNCRSLFLRNVTIANSLSTGLTLLGSLVTVSNSLILRNNTGKFGGGLAINDKSFIILSVGSSLEFISNHASRKGGGIFSQNDDLVYPFIDTESYNNTSIPMVFWNNTAEIAGDDVYGFTLFDTSIPFFFRYPNISSSTDPVKLCFCNPNNTNTMYYSNCFDSLTDQDIFPGQMLEFNIALFGNDGNDQSFSPTNGVVDISLDNVEVSSYSISNPGCSQIKYSPKKCTFTRHLIILSGSYYQRQAHFTMHECPLGFSIDNSRGVCSCSQSVSRENVTCDIVSLNVAHNGLLWIGMRDTAMRFNANQTNPNACIVNEDCLLYCSPNPVTFKMNDTDPQCVDNRGQRMCGSCRDGYSLLMGSNKCGRCGNYWYNTLAWIALFAVMGLLLVIILIALNLTVSVGTLNGLLFYANIVKLYEPVFSRNGGLPVLSQVISWINLDFGIEACLYNGMDSYVKQWLQFAFPFYLWMIIIAIIKLCRKYGKISKLVGSQAVPVLSTTFLLSYTKLVRTIVIVLHKREVTLHCTNGSTRSVSLWHEDPNIEYAKGKHAGLFGFALFVATFIVIPYTLFLLFNPLFEKYLSNYRKFKKLWSYLKPVIDAYSGPLKDVYRFWPGLLLVARIPILLSVTLVDSFIQSHYFLLCVLLTVLAIVLSLGHCFGGVYRLKVNNIIEVWFLFNLCIMAGLSVAFKDGIAVLVWFNTCLSVFAVSFVLIAFYHLYLQLVPTKWFKILINIPFKKKDGDESLLDVTDPYKTVDQQRREFIPTSTDVIKDRRESVVFLF